MENIEVIQNENNNLEDKQDNNEKTQEPIVEEVKQKRPVGRPRIYPIKEKKIRVKKEKPVKVKKEKKAPIKRPGAGKKAGCLQMKSQYDLYYLDNYEGVFASYDQITKHILLKYGVNFTRDCLQNIMLQRIKNTRGLKIIKIDYKSELIDDNEYIQKDTICDNNNQENNN